METLEIAAIREEYSKKSLSETEVNEDPIKQFHAWFSEAIKSEVNTPNAMSLATVNNENKPSCRIVLLKGLEDGKFKFFTNYASSKGNQILDNPHVALTFFWPELERQVRIEGKIEKLPETESEEYFHSRPEGSQIGAWSSPQSEKIDGREILEDNEKKYAEKFEGQKIPKPSNWGGYAVEPSTIEFWQGRPSRLHDRILFEKVVPGKSVD